MVFLVVDVVEILTDSKNPTDYLKKLRKRDPELNYFLGTNCPQIAMKTHTGVLRKTLAADMTSIFRLIQSIPEWLHPSFRLTQPNNLQQS